jgi:hypothetical protein
MANSVTATVGYIHISCLAFNEWYQLARVLQKDGDLFCGVLDTLHSNLNHYHVVVLHHLSSSYLMFEHGTTVRRSPIPTEELGQFLRRDGCVARRRRFCTLIPRLSPQDRTDKVPTRESIYPKASLGKRGYAYRAINVHSFEIGTPESLRGNAKKPFTTIRGNLPEVSIAAMNLK